MIYINGRFLLQTQTGVNRFAYELCKALSKLNVSFALLCPPGRIQPCYDVSDFKIQVCGWGKSHVWEQIALPIYWNTIKGDKLLLNFTGLGPIAVKKKIMTIHDMGLWVTPEWYSKSYVALYKLLTPLSAKTSLKVLTVSNFSKREIVRLLNISPNNIEIVYNAVPSFFNNKVKNENVQDGCSEKYILAVSSIDPRKNFERLVNAFSLLKNEDIKLYIVGGQNRIFNNKQNVDGTDTIKWLGRISDEDLKRYYQNALAFIYPSLYEGFGIPAIEAMALDCPVIASDIPVMHEVCGNAAFYINPYSEKDIAQGIKDVLLNENLREQIQREARKQLMSFSWEKSAKKLLSIIKNLY